MKAIRGGAVICGVAGTIFLALPGRSGAVVYPFPGSGQQHLDEIAVFRQPGAVVRLFYGFMPDSVHALSATEHSVVREFSTSCPLAKRFVGKVRLTRITGEHFAEALVTEGEIREGDVVALGGSYAVVVDRHEDCETTTPEQRPAR